MMGIFFGLIGIVSIIPIGLLGVFIPVVWCYAFFDQMNLAGVSDNIFFSVEDEYFITRSQLGWFDNHIVQKYKKEIAIGLVLLGGYQLVDSFLNILSDELPGLLGKFFWSIDNAVPQIIIALLIIYWGLKMIGSKKQELGQDATDYEPEMFHDMQEVKEERQKETKDVEPNFVFYETNQENQREQKENNIANATQREQPVESPVETPISLSKEDKENIKNLLREQHAE